MSKYSYKPHASYWLRDWEDDDILVTNMNDVERKFLYPFSYSNLNKCEPINPLAPVTKILSVFFIIIYFKISQFNTTSSTNFLVNMDDVCPYQLFSKYFFCSSTFIKFISLHNTFGRLSFSNS